MTKVAATAGDNHENKKQRSAKQAIWRELKPAAALYTKTTVRTTGLRSFGLGGLRVGMMRILQMTNPKIVLEHELEFVEQSEFYLVVIVPNALSLTQADALVEQGLLVVTTEHMIRPGKRWWNSPVSTHVRVVCFKLEKWRNAQKDKQ